MKLNAMGERARACGGGEVCRVVGGEVCGVVGYGGENLGVGVRVFCILM